MKSEFFDVKGFQAGSLLKFTGIMNKLRSVYDYELEIKYFSVSRRNGLFSSEKRRKLGTKQISINLGENETKW